MLTIWGRATSFNVQKVLWLCDELELPWRRMDAGGEFGVNDSSWFLARNPNGLVPLLEDGDFTLWESNAILRYLAGKAKAEALYPSEPRQRADVDRWLDWQLGTLWPAMRPFFVGLTRTPQTERDHLVIAASRRRTGELWQVVEQRLQDGPYLAGTALSLAEIALGSLIHRWFALDCPPGDRPRLHELYQRLCGNENFRRHVVMQPLPGVR